MDSQSTSDGERFFALLTSSEPDAMHFDAADDLSDPERLLRGEAEPRDPILFRRTAGSRVKDLMGETFGVLYIVSDLFVSILENASLIGWRLYPVRLLDPKGRELKGFHGLAVTGRAGHVDRSRSQLVRRISRGGRAQPLFAEVGMYFDSRSWDGTDLFIPAGTSLVCLADRAAEVVEGASLTNVQVRPLSDYQLGIHAGRPQEP